MLYWADHGGEGIPAKIGSMTLDGKYVQNVYQRRVEVPQDLVIDIEQNTLYWTDVANSWVS